MSVKLPNGILFSLATAYSASKPISAMTNAEPTVVTAVAHGLDDGDIVEVKSGWNPLNERVFKVDQLTTDTLSLLNTNTSDVTRYPTGGGAGSLRQVTTWQQIQQITESSTSGGEMQFTSYSFLENDFESQLPTQASAQSLQLTIADDPALPGYQALKRAAETREVRALRAQLPDGSFILYNGYVSFNETPTMNKGSIMTVVATFSLMSRPVRYNA
ncbi:phage tail protein [Xenophilus sp. Marseille-Q4582]|uniref:phage tail protein n=1 Tax=Xenophilus sp. Marseille-Q4582 TaxID=2866600 RepID=UPI001CE3FD55|nr:phage tail protein [Xenophilus sp. Marseille-Q4582]